MTEYPDPLAGTGPGDLSRARELLDEQHRRILELSDAVADGEQRLVRSTASLSWRSPSRQLFDVRLGNLRASLTRSADRLDDALAECERARHLLDADLAAARRRGEREKEYIGYPAGRSR